VGPSRLAERVGRTTYQIPLNAFFQTNYEQAAALQRTARQLAGLTGRETLVDLHSGVGFFAVNLAPQVKQVIGVERNREAVAAARQNAKLNGARNTTFHEAAAADGLGKFKRGEIDVLIMDPPRAGLEDGVLDKIADLCPSRVVYFSCAPDLLARDIGILKKKGYRFVDCVPIDMFPHTHHVEVAAKLIFGEERKQPGAPIDKVPFGRKRRSTEPHPFRSDTQARRKAARQKDSPQR
ncbi:MAG TPA: class I SAM-dependent RNA methyltransferase, partial [Spirochaetia bacterium]|nr:class I SAM-dependent RNA methyltransferase [Spirochaetia bacterium]